MATKHAHHNCTNEIAKHNQAFLMHITIPRQHQRQTNTTQFQRKGYRTNIDQTMSKPGHFSVFLEKKAYICTNAFIMTPFRHFSTNKTYVQRIRRGGLYVAVAALLATHTQCGSRGNTDMDWEEVTTYEVTQGVVTTLEEVEPERFEITDERVVERRDASRVIIRRLDGQIDTLTIDQASGLISAQDTSRSEQLDQRRGHGMGGVLWWGAMGYMMGRNMGTSPASGIYRPGASSTAAAQQLRQTAIPRTQMRPVSGKSGYFNNSGRPGATS